MPARLSSPASWNWADKLVKAQLCQVGARNLSVAVAAWTMSFEAYLEMPNLANENRNQAFGAKGLSVAVAAHLPGPTAIGILEAVVERWHFVAQDLAMAGLPTSPAAFLGTCSLEDETWH